MAKCWALGLTNPQAICDLEGIQGGRKKIGNLHKDSDYFFLADEIHFLSLLEDALK